MHPPTGDSPSGTIFDRYQSLLSVLLIVAIGIGGALFVLRQPPPTTITIIPPPPTATPLPTLPPTPSPTPGPIQVYVTGEVAHAGQVISLPFGSRVADALEAAGGMTNYADATRVNLADILRDGDQVHVFARTDSGVADALLATPADQGIVYVNTASAVELESLPRVGPALAERIITYREENGPFAQLEDLLNVSGIGPTTLEAIAPMISLEIR